jgi:hypothetical protein
MQQFIVIHQKEVLDVNQNAYESWTNPGNDCLTCCIPGFSFIVPQTVSLSCKESPVACVPLHADKGSKTLAALPFTYQSLQTAGGLHQE